MIDTINKKITSSILLISAFSAFSLFFINMNSETRKEGNRNTKELAYKIDKLYDLVNKDRIYRTVVDAKLDNIDYRLKRIEKFDIATIKKKQEQNTKDNLEVKFGLINKVYEKIKRKRPYGEMRKSNITQSIYFCNDKSIYKSSNINGIDKCKTIIDFNFNKGQ